MYEYVHLDGREGRGITTWAAMEDALGRAAADDALDMAGGLNDLDWQHRRHHTIRAVAPAVGRESGEQIGEFHMLWTA